MASLSVGARVTAVVAAMPITAALAVRGTQPLADKAIQALGLTVTVGIGLTAMQAIGRVPIKSLWSLELTWRRQIGLVLVGALAGSVVSAAYLLISNKEIRTAVLERVFGKV